MMGNLRAARMKPGPLYRRPVNVNAPYIFAMRVIYAFGRCEKRVNLKQSHPSLPGRL